jgi:23S rRNA pseudouridine1911/1915/1917 synthase
MKNKLTLYIDKKAHTRIDKAIFEALPENLKLSRSRLQALIIKGAVINSHDMLPISLKTRIKEIEKINICFDPIHDFEVIPQDLCLDIVYEDDALAVINKPVNMSVHPVSYSQKDTLVNGLRYIYGNNLAQISDDLRPGIVHRLDKDTSGLIVIAKTNDVAVNLTNQFKSRQVKKTYLAFCHGHPFDKLGKLISRNGVEISANGHINVDTYIGRDQKNRELMAVKTEDGKRAISEFEVLEVFNFENKNKVSLIKCNIQTGRTHQIRVHLKYLGHPILGDKLYGLNYSRKKIETDQSTIAPSDLIKKFSRQALHAHKLSFSHPVTSERKTFSLSLSEDLRKLEEALRQSKGRENR